MVLDHEWVALMLRQGFDGPRVAPPVDATFHCLDVVNACQSLTASLSSTRLLRESLPNLGDHLAVPDQLVVVQLILVEVQVQV